MLAAIPCLHVQASWSGAYFDEGGANRPIITYSVPIRQDGVFVGVVTMDVGLDPTSTLGMGQAAAFEEPLDSQAGECGDLAHRSEL